MISRSAAILAAALALPACGGDSAMEGLRAYEASVEKLMERDGEVKARLEDLRADVFAVNASTEEMGAYSRDEAAPFYHRFREAAAKAPAEDERLAKVHALLVEYIDLRLAYLVAIEGVLGSQKSEGMDRLLKAQAAWGAATAELSERTEKAGVPITDAGVLDVVRRRGLFMKAMYEPFRMGEIPIEQVEEALRDEILPRLQKVAERSRGNMTAEGIPGALARWAAAELDFFRELAATLPLQVSGQKSALAAQKAWDGAAEIREKYLAGIRAYRDSLR